MYQPDCESEDELPHFVTSVAEQQDQEKRYADVTEQANRLMDENKAEAAVGLLTSAISTTESDAACHLLFATRSAAFSKLFQFESALQDAIRSRELNPCWPDSYYYQGVALNGLGRYADAMAAFSSGLSLDSSCSRLLISLIETAMKSPLRAGLEPIYRQLQSLGLDTSPFIITSVIGNELLSVKHTDAAIVVLESSLRIGTNSMKLRGCVYSALSSAYWTTGQYDRAIQFMQSDLQICKLLGDTNGELRAYANLGCAYYIRLNNDV